MLIAAQFLTQPGHRTIEVVQVETVAAGDAIVLAPAISGQIRAAAHQPMQHGEEHRALQRKAVAAAARQRHDHALAAGLLPQPLEQQRRADASHRDGRSITGPGGIQHHRLLGEARTRAQQPIELAGGFEFVQPPERRDHPLAHLIAGPMALHDLQVDAPLRLFAAEVHVRLDRVRTDCRRSPCSQQKTSPIRGTTNSANSPTALNEIKYLHQIRSAQVLKMGHR